MSIGEPFMPTLLDKYRPVGYDEPRRVLSKASGEQTSSGCAMEQGNIASAYSGYAGAFKERLRSHRRLLSDIGLLNELGVLVERAAYEELTGLLVTWLLQQCWGGGNRLADASVDTVARIISGVILRVALPSGARRQACSRKRRWPIVYC